MGKSNESKKADGSYELYTYDYAGNKKTSMEIISVLLLIIFVFTSCTLGTSEPKIKAISAGDYFSLLVDTNGNVWSSGGNEYGSLGDGTTENRNTFGRIKELANIKSVSAGRLHSLALDADGNVWSWGLNEKGQLGDGTKNNSIRPIKIEILSDIISISSGGGTSLALKKDGTVWAFGNNEKGQLGIGSFESQTRPVKVIFSKDNY